MNSLHVLSICGSIRQPSHTQTLTAAVGMALEKGGMKPALWNLRECPLPVADPKFHDDPIQHTDERVRAFVKAAIMSDAFVFASPIYHNSYSGVLKNALDHLAISCCYYKPVGLISHGGNQSSQAVDHLRIVVRGLLGVAIPTQVCTADSDYVDMDGKAYHLSSEAILKRIERFAAELTSFGYMCRGFREM
jgi:azobenzene reductase